MFSSLKLSLKLSLGFGALLLLMLVSGGVAQNALSSLNYNADQLAKNWLPSIREVAKLDKYAQGVRRYQLLYLTETSEQARNKSREDIAQRSAELEKARKVYEPMISSPEERVAYEEFGAHWKAYTDKIPVILDLADKGRMQEALAESGTIRDEFSKALDAIQKDIDINDRGGVNEAKAAEATYARGKTLSFTILALAVLASAGIAFLLIRGVLTQLGEDPGYLGEVAGKIAGGDLNVAFRPQKKEGGVYHVMQGMVQTMKSKIAEAEQKTAEAAEQARLAAVATDEANEAKARAERAKAEGMLQAARQLEGVVEVVTSASEELSAQIEQSSRGAEQQSQRVSETATAMEEMNATVLEVAKNAQQAAETSDRARKQAQEGEGVVGSVVKGIGEVREQSHALKTDMATLGKQAEAIGQIMNVISDIADQTNLLALNAAIEAARAGDAGRGFAVVADEVRKLAEKTMTATKEVGDAIHGIQNGTRKNMENVDRSAGTIEQATELAIRSGESLKRIVALVDSSSDQVRSIATASEQQSAASEEINRSVEQVATISAETAQAMGQASQAVSELARQAQVLQNLIAEMKAQGQAA